MATGVGWIVPKKYIEKIGSDAFKNQPVGLGPYRLVSHQPGIEVVLEANTDYWRKTPHVKRLVLTPGTRSRSPSATGSEALLHKIQQKVYDEARFMPIWESAFLCASGPRVAVSGLYRDSFAYSAPYEDVQLKSS